MKEILELRINYDYAHLLFSPQEGKDIGQLSTKSVKIVHLSKDDPRYHRIPVVDKYVKENFNRGFYFGWWIKRAYTEKEINEACLFHFRIKTVFEPSGEECGTEYNDTNSEQISPLKLRKSNIPRKDISKTIAGEVVVSERFKELFEQKKLKGAVFTSVFSDNKILTVSQLNSSIKLELSEKTIVGDDPFNIVSYNKDVYQTKDLLGLNLISEPYVYYTPLIKQFDLFVSSQKIGTRRGLLRPKPVFLCSPAFRNMVIKEKLSGFEFEIAKIEVG